MMPRQHASALRTAELFDYGMDMRAQFQILRVVGTILLRCSNRMCILIPDIIQAFQLVQKVTLGPANFPSFRWSDSNMTQLSLRMDCRSIRYMWAYGSLLAGSRSRRAAHSSLIFSDTPFTNQSSPSLPKREISRALRNPCNITSAS